MAEQLPDKPRRGAPCNGWTGNPGKWPRNMPHKGESRFYHWGCLSDLLRDAARYRWLREHFFRHNDSDLYDSPVNVWAELSAEDFAAKIDAAIAREEER